MGCAFDFDVKGLSAEEARASILRNQTSPLLANVKRLEGGVNWVHADTMATEHAGIYVFRV